jgi:RHH-type transcriptional regulator, rel operon repressor / antitoxin RelB
MAKSMISARIPEELDVKLEVLAEATQRSKAFLLTEALEDYVARQSWLVKAVDEAVEDAAKDGRYVAEEDMSAWLRQWGNAESTPLPKLRHRDE